VLNVKYTSSNQVTSHPYRSGLHVAKNWNKKQLVLYMKAEKINYGLLDHVIVQSHTWLPTFSYNCLHGPYHHRGNRQHASFPKDEQDDMSSPRCSNISFTPWRNKAPLWGYTIMSIIATLIDTYIPVTLPPLAHYSIYLPCTSAAQYHFHKQLPLFTLATR